MNVCCNTNFSGYYIEFLSWNCCILYGVLGSDQAKGGIVTVSHLLRVYYAIFSCNLSCIVMFHEKQCYFKLVRFLTG